jgi:hypothetical protein
MSINGQSACATHRDEQQTADDGDVFHEMSALHQSTRSVRIPEVVKDDS